VQGQTHRRFVSTVRDGLLLTNDAAGQQITIVVGSDDWHIWLESAMTFAYSSTEGHFTARKERFRRGGWYWKGYCSANRKLYRVYLGKSEHLTLDRLSTRALLLFAHMQTTALRKPGQQAAGGNSRRQKVESGSVHGSEHGPDGYLALRAVQHCIPALPSTMVSRHRVCSEHSSTGSWGSILPAHQTEPLRPLYGSEDGARNQSSVIAVRESGAYYSQVEAEWTIPNNMLIREGYTATTGAWVGLDGFSEYGGDGNLLQAGFGEALNYPLRGSLTRSCYTFWEDFPNGINYTDNHVSCSDARVCAAPYVAGLLRGNRPLLRPLALGRGSGGRTGL
jgi:hypothetical protein